MADQIVSWGGFNSKGTSGMGVTGSFQVSSSANSFFVGGGNVGVGTASPSYPLDVSGNTRFQGTGLFTSGANNQISVIANADGSTPYINFQNSGVGTSRLNAFTAASGNLINSSGMSITTTSTSSFLSLKANDIVAASNIESLGGRYYLSSATGNNGILFLHPGVSYRGLIGFDASSTYFQIRTGYTTDFSAGNLNAAFFDSGNSAFGSSTDMSARLGVKGSGTTSSTTSFLVQNNAGAAALTILDDKSATFGGDVRTNSITNYYTGQELLVTSAGSNSRVNMVSYGAYSNYSFRLAQYYNYSTTGSYNTVLITDGDTFYSTGSAANTLLTIAPAINSQGGSHIYRGIYINPSKYNNPQFTDLRAIETTAGNIIVNGGSVGIGISTPSSSLHISGASAVLTLTPQSPLPSGVPTGSFAVSSSAPPKPYFYDGTTWNALY